MIHPVRRVRRLARRARNLGVALALRGALWFLGRLTLDRALRLSERTAERMYRILRQPRRRALEHLRLAFGDELSPTAREHLARASFVNIARCFCEVAKIDELRVQRDSYFEVEGWEHVRTVLAGGKGAIMITGHIGNWEVLGAYFAWCGFPVAALARRVYAGRVNRLLIAFRKRQGVDTILRESPHATREIGAVLRANALLTVVVDQDMAAPSMPGPFLGRLARTPGAAAALAIRNELPVTAVFIQRRGEGGHRITVSPPFEIEHSGDRRADVAALTRQVTVALETQIRKNPAECVWWERRGQRGRLPHLELDRDIQYTSANVEARRRG